MSEYPKKKTLSRALCGCKIVMLQYDLPANVLIIEPCSLHKAAHDLLEVCKAVAECPFTHEQMITEDGKRHIWIRLPSETMAKAVAAVEKAEEQCQPSEP